MWKRLRQKYHNNMNNKYTTQNATLVDVLGGGIVPVANIYYHNLHAAK